MNEWGGLISWSVVCSQCNTFLLQYLTGTSARTWLKTKDSKLTWPTATDLLLFLSDILRDVHWILEDQTLQLWIHIYILWGKDLAAGAEGAVKYWRLLRGNPNIALLFKLRLFFLLLTHLNFFFFFLYRNCKDTLPASRGIYKKKKTWKHSLQELYTYNRPSACCGTITTAVTVVTVPPMTANTLRPVLWTNDCQESSGEAGGFFFLPFFLRLDFIKVCSQKLWRVVLGIIQRDEIRRDGIQVWGRIREMDTLSVVWLVCISSVAIFIRNLPIIVCDCGL